MLGASEENIGRGLKRSFPVNGNFEIATEDAGGHLEGVGGEGGKEDVSEESLSKLQNEVAELAEKVAEYREKGPVAFANLLENTLAQMWSSSAFLDTQVNSKPTDAAAEIEDDEASLDKGKLPQRARLLKRLAVARASVPIILGDIKACKERLDKAMLGCRQGPAKDSSPHPTPARDVMEFLSCPDK
ncbi:unnamed protein product [Calypogeia fissa]